MHLYHLLAIHPSGIGRDYRWMLGEARFARPDAWGRVGDTVAEAILDQEVAPQQAEIAGDIIAELLENGGDLFVEPQRIVAIRQLRQELGSIRPQKPLHGTVPRWLVVAAHDFGVCTGVVAGICHRHETFGE